MKGIDMLRDKITRILKSRIRSYSPADDVEPHVTNADEVADLVLKEVKGEPHLTRIRDLCPSGTQIKSPGGLSIDLSTICAVESYDGRDGYIVVHLPNSTVKITFYDNVDGGAPEIYAIAAALQGRKWP